MMEFTQELQDTGIDTTTLTPAAYQRPGDAASFVMRVSAQQAIATWELLRRVTPSFGYWPVIGWDRFQKPPWQEPETVDILAAAEHVDVQRLLSDSELVGSCMHSYVREFSATAETVADDPSISYRIPFGRFPHTPQGHVPIALVPCDVPWKVPAFLRFSEDSHAPEEHVAVLRLWYQQWGAELVGWDSAQAELHVLRPPVGAAEACRLAVEHYHYCPDLVEQNLGSVTSLARVLTHANVWWFWWD